MNADAQRIAKWLNISEKTAELVRIEMAIYWGADFSENTEDELREIAYWALDEMRLNAAA